ncbi:adenine-specific DNA-methyltransferase [Limimonas halophila]|uniref:Adenine-specific DNA-methyltransferase n=1 Tax=Limimonas halophila TaxID=1082479 RepID=A0A1G7L4R1_9PROT|nr:DUF559 domain-containing protein [Limimonas halophila]SDF44445.1 adenine-specific DNA-methyltransferase [Limimonas halophila]
MAHRTRRARTLRRQGTDAEHVLWRHLRNRRLNCAKFRRQEPIGPYVADFCCREAGIIVEVDGGQHAEDTARDDRRTRCLNGHGYTVLRFWNTDVLKNLDGVLAVIARHLPAIS